MKKPRIMARLSPQGRRAVNAFGKRRGTAPKRFLSSARRRPGFLRPGVGPGKGSERRIFRRGAAAAHPWPGPVGGLALVGLDIGAPRLRLERGALVDDAELSVALDLADHDRLGHVVVRQHRHL